MSPSSPFRLWNLGVPFRRICAVLVAAIAASSCGSDSATTTSPLFTVATVGTTRPLRFSDACPWTLDFSIFLQADGTGRVAMEHEAFGSRMVEVTWSQDGSVVTLDGPTIIAVGEFQRGIDGYVESRVLSIVPEDLDHDGTAESGTGTVRVDCYWYEDFEDFHEGGPAELRLAIPAESAGLRFEENAHPQLRLLPLYTFDDTVQLRSDRAILAESAASISLLVDGTAVESTVTPYGLSGPFATTVRIDPLHPVPFSSTIGIDVGAATDAFGTPLVFDDETVLTVDDPGPITENMSFENDRGWIGLTTTPGDSQFPAVDGQRHAYVDEELVGYLDVPADASSLVFEQGVYDSSECSSSSAIDVLADVPLVAEVEEVEKVPCGFLCSNIPWHQVRYDLRTVRGKRIVVHAIAADRKNCHRDNWDELQLDHFRLQ
jgi:hypothetical protein